MLFGIPYSPTIATSSDKSEDEPIYFMADKSLWIQDGHAGWIQHTDPHIFNNRLYVPARLVTRIFPNAYYLYTGEIRYDYDGTCKLNDTASEIIVTKWDDEKTGNTTAKTVPITYDAINLIDDPEQRYWPVKDLADILGLYVYWNDGLVCITKEPFAPDVEYIEQIRSRFMEPSFNNSQIRRMDASLSVQPYLNLISNHLIGADDTYNNIAGYTNTIPAYEQLISGEKDLILVTEPSAEILALAEEKGVTLEAIPFAKEGFVFLVNSQNKVDSLRVDQLRDIYTGRITNWADIGGDNEAITAYQRNSSSGSQTIMESVFMKGIHQSRQSCWPLTAFIQQPKASEITAIPWL